MTTFTTCDAGLGTGKALPLGEKDISREGKVCGNSEPSSTWIAHHAGRLCCPVNYILENQHIPAEERDLDIRSSL